MIEVLLLLLSVPIGLGAGLYFAALVPEDGLRHQAGVVVAGLSEASPALAGLAVLGVGLQGSQVGALACGWALLLVPRLVRSVERALAEVDPGLQARAEALGATPWEALRTLVLPAAAPRLTGLAVRDVARTLGELAPLLVISAAGLALLQTHAWVAGAAVAWVVAANVLATLLEAPR